MGRIYDLAAWDRLRHAKLTDQPLCEVCLRRDVVEPAEAVDHIVAIEKGGDPFPPLSGLMSLCVPCHNSKTRRVDSADSKRIGGAFKGCDVDGNPLDPDDDWFAPAARSSREIDGRQPRPPSNTELVSYETKWEFV